MISTDLGRVGHAGDASGLAYVRRHTLKGHHRHGAGVLRYLGLVGGHHVHDDAALEHLGQPCLNTPSPSLGNGLYSHVINPPNTTLRG